MQGSAREHVPVLHDDIDYYAGSTETQIRGRAWPIYTEWIFQYLEDNGEVTRKKAEDSGSFKAKCSIPTIERYNRTLCSDEGPLEKVVNELNQQIIRFRDGG